MSSPDTQNTATSSALSAADELRSWLSELYSARPASRILLAPGAGVALKLLFEQLGVRRLAITDEEYYEPRHFPAQSAESFSTEESFERLAVGGYDAVLVSVVTWKGTLRPVAEVIDRLRSALPATCLLIADYTHAGAAGFPAAETFGADVVCGDAAKWIVPSRRVSDVAFLWFRSESCFQRALPQFAPHYLAAPGNDDPASTRWLRPRSVEVLSRWFSRARLSRRDLADQHTANMKLARRIAAEFGLPNPRTSILWMQAVADTAALTKWVEHGAIVHQFPNLGAVRVRCRTDMA